MKFKKTFLFGIALCLLVTAVYVFDYKRQEITEAQKDTDSKIIKFDFEQINMFEIIKKDEKIIIQKNEKGWSLLEPIQDKADNDQIEDLLKNIIDEKTLAVAKEASQLSEAELGEYGLNQPLAIFNIKNNLGQSKRISIGTQKNFEGNSYIRINSENTIYVAHAVWFNKAENKLIYYREKRLYRNSLADVDDIKITSLQDQFELKRNANVWTAVGFDHQLDQNKVREMLKKISESLVQDYVFEGEPSSALIDEMGLGKKNPVQIELSTLDTVWKVDININEIQNAVVALTDRPTRLVKLEKSSWEFFGNLNLDFLRDRSSLTRFDLSKVKKAYFKINNQEFNFSKLTDSWQVQSGLKPQLINVELLNDMLVKIHDLEISEFIDKKQVSSFKGHNMIILKTEADNLIYQLNWGPDFKMKKNGKESDYYYARTQVSSSIFAIEKYKIDKIFQKELENEATSHH